MSLSAGDAGEWADALIVDANADGGYDIQTVDGRRATIRDASLLRSAPKPPPTRRRHSRSPAQMTPRNAMRLLPPVPAAADYSVPASGLTPRAAALSGLLSQQLKMNGLWKSLKQTQQVVSSVDKCSKKLLGLRGRSRQFKSTADQLPETKSAPCTTRKPAPPSEPAKKRTSTRRSIPPQQPKHQRQAQSENTRQWFSRAQVELRLSSNIELFHPQLKLFSLTPHALEGKHALQSPPVEDLTL